MWKREVESNLLGSVINFDNLVGELEDKKFSGYVKVETWEFIDYVVFYSGRPLGVIRKREGGKEFLEFSQYTLYSESKISVYESSPLLTAHLSKELNMEKFQTLIFSGYGDEVFFSQLNIVDFDKFKEFIKKSNFAGYFTLYTPLKVLANFFCLEGEVVGINCGELWDYEAFKELESYGNTRFLSAYHIPPEEVCMLLSLKEGIKKGGNGTGFIVSREGVIQIIHEGLVLKSLKFYDEGIEEVYLDEPIKGSFYRINFCEEFPPLMVDLKRLQEIDSDYVGEDLLNRVREIFIDYIGPIGTILFKKVLGEYSYDPAKIPKSSFKAFVKRLEEEIPEEGLREEFRKKLEEVINEHSS